MKSWISLRSLVSILLVAHVMMPPALVHAAPNQSWSSWFLSKITWLRSDTISSYSKNIEPLVMGSLLAFGAGLIGYIGWKNSKNPPVTKKAPIAKKSIPYTSFKSEVFFHNNNGTMVPAANQAAITTQKEPALFALFQENGPGEIAQILKENALSIFAKKNRSNPSIPDTIQNMIVECNELLKIENDAHDGKYDYAFAIASIFVIDKGQGYFGNIGNMKGYLIRNKIVTDLKIDHTLKVKAENIGVRKRGGTIEDLSIKGQDITKTIVHSRALAGYGFKGLGRSPSVISVGPLYKGDVIVLATLGLSIKTFDISLRFIAQGSNNYDTLLTDLKKSANNFGGSYTFIVISCD